MQILFLHNSFPARFGFLGQYLARQGWDVWFGAQGKTAPLSGLRVFAYEPHRNVSSRTHPFASSFETAVLNGQAVGRAALKLQSAGLDPDVVVARSGYGPGLFVKDLWPRAKYVGYFEWYCRAAPSDAACFGGEARSMDDRLRARTRNAAILSDLVSCDIGVTPTRFQHDQLPDCFKDKVRVIHEGVDVDACRADRSRKLQLRGADLTQAAEVITYAARGLGPCRGFPQFMKALEGVLKRRPEAHAVIVGEDRLVYGKNPFFKASWKQRMLKELDLDWERVHFTGPLPCSRYLEVLQASTVHVYLTVPFALSSSMMEAMSAECAIVASNNAPVREMIDDGVHGALVDLADTDALETAICSLLDDRERRYAYGAAARRRIVERYDAKDLMAKRKELFESLV